MTWMTRRLIRLRFCFISESTRGDNRACNKGCEKDGIEGGDILKVKV